MRPPRVDADPSEEPQPGKAKSEYRNYTEGKLLDRVYTTYLLMHTHQTVDFVRRKSAEYGGCSLRRMSVMEALELLDQLVDESDPDVDFPNSFHAYQTAEGIRRAHPDKGPPGTPVAAPQWAVVGDTFPVGCKVQKSVVFSDSTFHENPDSRDPRYSTECGMYQPHCGLENVLMSWGHDGLLHGSLPLLLPVARARGLRAPLQRGGPAHAALGQGAQQVRPLHQAGGAARCAGAAGLLPVPHRQVLPGAALLVSWDPPTRSPSPPGTQHCTRPPCLPRTLPRGTRPSINLLGTHRGAGRSQGTGLGRARWGGCSRTKWDQHSPHFSPWPPQPFWCEGEARGWNVKGFI
ncbi:inositol oxygenase isoform X3 [Anser cygnoides]|uniref:inositol oxygenase isoform X3 n=1 Tax=Anser cygnoides TaxID=8845 RepID=UPI0034D2C7ED